MRFLLIFLATCFGAVPALHAHQQQDYVVTIGMLTDDAPASMLMRSGQLNGIGVELVEQMIRDLPVKSKIIQFDDREQAVQAIRKNDVQLLVGSFEENPTLEQSNISSTNPYFIDILSVVSIKKDIRLYQIMGLIFNRLFLYTFFGSILVGFVIALVLFYLEKDKHPHFKDQPNLERISYSLFTVFSCFFRDLLYDPVTSAGRVLFSVWMVFSVFVITILAALVTSSVLYLMNHGGQVIHHADDLRNSKVGILFGKPRLDTIIKKSGATPVVYSTNQAMFEALKHNDVDHIATGSTNLADHFSRKPQDMLTMTVSDIALGYETWTLYANKYYGSIVFGEPLLDIFDRKINLYRNDFKLYNICSHYIPEPEHCVF